MMCAIDADPCKATVPRHPSLATSILLVLLLGLSSIPTSRAVLVSQNNLSRDDQEARRAIKQWRQAIEDKADALVTYLMFVDLAAFDLPSIAKEAIKELERGPIEYRPAARRLIEAFKELDTLEIVLTDGLRHKDAAVRAQVILALGTGQPSGIDWIPTVDAALDDRSDAVRAAAVEALGLARACDSLDHVLSLQEDASVRVRQTIPEALVRMIGERSLPLVVVYGDDPSWRVQAAAVRALGALGTPQSVEALVDLLELESGRVREDAWRQLVKLTRRELGPDADAWRRSLSLRPLGSLAPAAAPDGGALPDRPAEPTSVAAPQSESLVSRVVYYGLSTLSRRLVFVNDCSKSMGMQEEPTIERPQDASHGRLSRLGRMKQQLTELLAGLGPEVAFNLVSFSGDVNTWLPRLVTMDSRRRSDALKEIHGYALGSGTNLYAAIDACFEMAKPSLDDAEAEPACPDTVFLLTDGMPTGGRIADTRLLLEYIAERNRDLHLRFECIALTTDIQPIAFMRQLAQATDGDSICPYER